MRVALRNMRVALFSIAASALAGQLAGLIVPLLVIASLAACSGPSGSSLGQMAAAASTPSGTASPRAGSSPTARPAGSPTRAAAPSATSTPKAKAPGYLRAAGSRLVDADGNEVILTGINWFGMETATYAPHGIWTRGWQEMLDQIAALGYNVIRLPYSSQVLDPASKPLEGIDYNLNPDLKGLNGLEIMDRIVTGAGQRGIKIILDRHRPNPSGQSRLWYTDDVPEDQWISDWQILARRYKDNDTVIGADLHNEPAGDATWGTGDPKTDWRLAAEKAGNAILDVNPNWLIVVEGIEKHQGDWYWMGGNLQGAAQAPVRLSHPDKLVYSAHDYGPGVFSQRWFQDKEFPANLPAVWDSHWGYLVKQNIAPVLVGEFGGRSVGSDAEGVWQRALVDYLKQNRISYTYWSLNPNSGDTGGILDDDWTTVHKAKQDLLASYQGPRLPIANPTVVDTSANATARKKPLPEQQVKVLFHAGRPEARTDQLAIEIQVVNQSESRLPLDELALSYWFAAPGLSASDQALSVDWSSVDQKLLRAQIVVDPRGGQTHRISVSFGKDAGMLAAHGTAEIKLRVKRGDGGTYSQADGFSYRPSNSYADNDRIALYFWGTRIWGQEPK